MYQTWHGSYLLEIWSVDGQWAWKAGGSPATYGYPNRDAAESAAKMAIYTGTVPRWGNPCY